MPRIDSGGYRITHRFVETLPGEGGFAHPRQDGLRIAAERKGQRLQAVSWHSDLARLVARAVEAFLADRTQDPGLGGHGGHLKVCSRSGRPDIIALGRDLSEGRSPPSSVACLPVKSCQRVTATST